MAEISKKEFSQKIASALETLTVEEIADQFGASRKTVELWVNPDNTPPSLAFSIILGWVDEQLKKRCKPPLVHD